MCDFSLACQPVVDEMTARVQQWQACADRRAVFLDCYLRMTHNMIDAINAGEFHDAAWVARLLRHFAGYYFDALHAYEQDYASAPTVWRIAHDAAGRPSTMTLQTLFLGVNAHINYDLVLVVVELLQPEWACRDEDERRRCYADYTHVNEIIARTIGVVQDEIIARATPTLALLDALLGRIDEWATAQLAAGMREEVWRHAVAMLETPDAVANEARRQAVEAVTLRRAEWILGYRGE